MKLFQLLLVIIVIIFNNNVISYYYNAISIKSIYQQKRNNIKDLSINNKDRDFDVSSLDDDDYYLTNKPWRAPKIKYLTYNYLTFRDNWKERYYTLNDFNENIFIYNQPVNRPIWERTRLDEYWFFPWFWSKNKVERICWIQKHFDTNIESMSVQEHMEFEALFSEIDMPQRWIALRYREIEVFFIIIFNLSFFTDFNGIRPTDLGLRPDGTLRTCPVQFHNCISSSNDPLDTDHYAPPLRWSRGKSPEQAYDEIKNVYMNYPKRGLKYSSGWIDRGGWKPKEFSGNYFHAEADELLFQFTDDIEFLLNPNKREVYIRSTPRLYQDSDYDSGRLRYNQFVRMLLLKGGWEIEPMNKLDWQLNTPYYLVDHLLDKSINTLNSQVNNMLTSDNKYVNQLANNVNDVSKLLTNEIKEVIKIYNELVEYLLPYIEPAITSINDNYESIRYDPRVASALQKLLEFRDAITNAIDTNDNAIQNTIDKYVNKIYELFPEKEDDILDSTIDIMKIEIDSNINIDSDIKIVEDKKEDGKAIYEDIESTKSKSINPSSSSTNNNNDFIFNNKDYKDSYKKYLNYFNDKENQQIDEKATSYSKSINTNTYNQNMRSSDEVNSNEDMSFVELLLDDQDNSYQSKQLVNSNIQLTNPEKKSYKKKLNILKTFMDNFINKVKYNYLDTIYFLFLIFIKYLILAIIS